jgi:predicted O-methyltransferase YrrM
MEITNLTVDQYCSDYSTSPSKVCQELGNHTKENHPLGRMVCGDLVASLLGFLIRTKNVKSILELGTFTGYSALAMAENLPSDGKVITIDKNKKMSEFTQEHWSKSEHGNKITALFGNGLDVLETLDSKFDLVFIDADKGNYLNYLKKCLTLLSENGMIIIDNVLWSGRVTQNYEESDETTQAIQNLNNYIKNSDDIYSTLLPVRDGLYLIQKK